MQTLLSTWQAYRTDGQGDRVNRYINKMLAETDGAPIWRATRIVWDLYLKDGDATKFESFLTGNRFFMEKFFPMGSVQVWYYREEYARDAHFSDFASMIGARKPNKMHSLDKTHILLCHTNIEDKEILFTRFQDWPGIHSKETNAYLDSIGLTHTSMSVGDIVVIDENTYLCASMGWTRL